MKSVKKIFKFWKKGPKSEEEIGVMPIDMVRRIPLIVPQSTSLASSGESSSNFDADDEATISDSADELDEVDEERERRLHNGELVTLVQVPRNSWKVFDVVEQSNESISSFTNDAAQDDDVTESLEMTSLILGGESGKTVRTLNEDSTTELPNQELPSQSGTYFKESNTIKIETGAGPSSHAMIRRKALVRISQHDPSEHIKPANQFNQLEVAAVGISRPIMNVHKYEGYGLFGLSNIGNTCYMNSVLQCLCNTQPFIEKILDDEALKIEIKQSQRNKSSTSSTEIKLLVECFKDLVKSVWKPTFRPSYSSLSTFDSRNAAVGDTTQLKLAIEDKTPMFKGEGQHDAHEFLRYFLDGVHTELNRPKKAEANVQVETTETTENEWTKYLLTDNSIVVDDFVGQLKSTLTCSKCGYESIKYEAFWDLSLPIPYTSGQSSKSASITTISHGSAESSISANNRSSNSDSNKNQNTTIHDCLQLLFEESSFDQENLVYCSKCASQEKIYKKLSIEKYPHILVIHLKRFSSESKLRTRVQFPLYGLDMKSFSSKFPDIHGISYNLYGLVNHIGSSNIGHYVAYCKHPFNYFHEWFKYDDTFVSMSDPSIVAGCTSDAYLLLYQMSTATQSLFEPSTSPSKIAKEK